MHGHCNAGLEAQLVSAASPGKQALDTSAGWALSLRKEDHGSRQGHPCFTASLQSPKFTTCWTLVLEPTCS